MKNVIDKHCYLGAQLVKHLNLPDGVTKLTITLEGGRIPLVHAEISLTNADQAFDIGAEFQTFQLMPY